MLFVCHSRIWFELKEMKARGVCACVFLCPDVGFSYVGTSESDLHPQGANSFNSILEGVVVG